MVIGYHYSDSWREGWREDRVSQGYVGFLKLGRLKGVQSHQVISPLFGRRHIDLESYRRDLQLEVLRERYSRSKLLFQNLQILFKVDFDQGFEGLRLSSFERVLGFIKVPEFEGVHGFLGILSLGGSWKTRFHGVQDEKRVWFELELRKAQGDHEAEVGANITVIGVPGQEGAEGNVAEKKKVKESMKANLRKLLKCKAWLTRRSPVRGSSIG
ncbi:hypothetical protein Tco_1088340 [Tanacetum coccineum]